MSSKYVIPKWEGRGGERLQRSVSVDVLPICSDVTLGREGRVPAGHATANDGNVNNEPRETYAYDNVYSQSDYSVNSGNVDDRMGQNTYNTSQSTAHGEQRTTCQPSDIISVLLLSFTQNFFLAPETARDSCAPFLQRCFMVDKDMSEINALKEVFPDSDILICWYNVLQAIVRWLMKTDSGVSGPTNSSTRAQILDFFEKMKAYAMVWFLFVCFYLMRTFLQKIPIDSF
ncbi:uncharacterized protein LOC122969391 [Thunnus albacares]|uniref:uncharacterized protein LOC122969391 n=1 Tax=Thunnus albacares TaxID=8236 RepID=UPI001CF6BA69|nr:uncharacterized protein LOC122969391 [Thunnus albacares]